MNNLMYFIIGMLAYQVGIQAINWVRRIIILKKLDREKKKFEENFKSFAEIICRIAKEDIKRVEHANDLPFAGGFVKDTNTTNGQEWTINRYGERIMPNSLKDQIDEAIDREDYELAAKLRDSLK